MIIVLGLYLSAYAVVSFYNMNTNTFSFQPVGGGQTGQSGPNHRHLWLSNIYAV